jgi:putative SOS response-associated peptidase YedK
MCGRFAFSPFRKIIEERFDVEVSSDLFNPRYNCAPSQNLAVITNAEPSKLSYLKWGLVPFWAKDPKIGYSLINAKAETLNEKPSFKNSFRRKRCLVPACSFYEWKPEGKNKIPYRIFLKNEPLFAMAGLWDSWKSENEMIINSFSIITTEANDFMLNIHSRMPVILPKESEKKWLEDDNIGFLTSLLKPIASECMDAYQVSARINSPVNDDEEITKRVY